MKALSELTRGLIKENPVFVMVLGMCPTLATTSSAQNGFGMGIAALFVLVFSNIVISLVKKLVPDQVRIAIYIVVIATFVTIVQLSLKAYMPALDKALGIFIPLIVVNCIILARAEAYASKNNVFYSALDGIGVGAGFTIALTILGAIREILGDNKLFGHTIVQNGEPMLFFILAPGGFLTLGILMALFNKLKASMEKKQEG